MIRQNDRRRGGLKRTHVRQHIGGAVLVALMLSVPATGAVAAEPEQKVATTLVAQPAAKAVEATVETYAQLTPCRLIVPMGPFPPLTLLQYLRCVAATVPENPTPTAGASAARTVELVATLTTATTNKPVAFVDITFRLSSGRVVHATTNYKGQARAVATAWTLEEDSYTATFAGTDKHLGSSASAALTGPIACVIWSYHLPSFPGPDPEPDPPDRSTYCTLPA